MDQRRFIVFLMLSVLVMVLFSILFPPPPPPKQPAKPVADAQKANEGENDDAAPDADLDQPAEADEPQDAAPPAAPAAALADAPLQYFSLGSLELESGYRMLVTLTNKGAAVERAELASPRYRDQHDRSGYIGELELKSVDGGAEVQVVGAGTPAAKAGIQVGDVIVAVGEQQANPIRTAEDLENALAKTEPGQQITLQVRGADGKTTPKTVQLNWRPFAVVRPEAENYDLRDEKLPENFEDPPSFLTTLVYFNGKPLDEAAAKRVAESLKAGNWEAIESNETSVTFRRVLPELQLEVVKQFTIDRAPGAKTSKLDVDYPAYDVRLEIELRNTANEARSIAYQLDGPTGMPLEGWWYAHKISRERWFGGAGLRDVVVRFDGNPVWQLDGPEIAAGDTEPMGGGEALAFAGVDGQYFAAVMIPVRDALGDAWFDTVEAVTAGTPLSPRTLPNYANVTSRLTRRPIELAAGATHRDAFQIFMGPKRPSLLAHYQAAGDPNHSLKDIVYYGLSLFGIVAQIMLAILHFFYGIVGNFGIAIILLTVCVRGAMFPISYKQTQNMARIQALKPEMDRITEKYKNDMPKRSQAIQELYRKHKINPLGGCLPLFLQLPIFIGLYRALMVDVELRLSPLFSDAIRWCSNLAAPDMFYDWSWFMPEFITSGQGFLGLGPYLNVLPLVTVALFLVTQKMAMPAPTNEQAAMQQKMMKWMTMFMGLLFYKVASGLCLYFIASSLWGIGERKMLPKSLAANGAAPAGAPDAKAERPARLSASASTTSADDRNGSGRKKRQRAKRKK